MDVHYIIHTHILICFVFRGKYRRIDFTFMVNVGNYRERQWFHSWIFFFFCIMAELAVEESVKYLGQGATNEVWVSLITNLWPTSLRVLQGFCDFQQLIVQKCEKKKTFSFQQNLWILWVLSSDRCNHFTWKGFIAVINFDYYNNTETEIVHLHSEVL